MTTLRRRRSHFIGAALCAAACASFTATPTFAAETTSGGARWVIEVDGASCGAKQRAVFEREITLACDAMRTCRVTPRKEAELEATLRCESDGTWKLQTRTVEGMNLTSLDLTGATPDDRMREAAIEIARDAAPERTLATETLNNTLSDGGGDKLKLGPPPLPTLLLSVGGLAAARASEAGAYGGRIVGALRIGSRDTLTHLTLGLMGVTGGSDATQLRRFRAGIGVAFGAPFTAHVVGVNFEAGIDNTQTYFGGTTTEGDLILSAVSKQAAYLQQNLVFQIPLNVVRPYLALSVGVMSSAPVIMGGAEAGVAFALF